MSTESTTKNPRVTITRRHNGRWYIGNLDDASMQALMSLVRLHMGQGDGKDFRWPQVQDGGQRLLKAVEKVRME